MLDPVGWLSWADYRQIVPVGQDGRLGANPCFAGAFNAPEKFFIEIVISLLHLKKVWAIYHPSPATSGTDDPDYHRVDGL
jgi:hypothetical protein